MQHRHELKRVLEELGASNIRLFGSVARGDDTSDSDVDLLVDVNEKVGSFALGRTQSEAERILGCCPSRYLTIAASSSLTMSFGGVVVTVTWWSSAVTAGIVVVVTVTAVFGHA